MVFQRARELAASIDVHDQTAHHVVAALYGGRCCNAIQAAGDGEGVKSGLDVVDLRRAKLAGNIYCDPLGFVVEHTRTELQKGKERCGNSSGDAAIAIPASKEYTTGCSNPRLGRKKKAQNPRHWGEIHDWLPVVGYVSNSCDASTGGISTMASGCQPRLFAFEEELQPGQHGFERRA